jgi:putative transposase
MDSFDTVFTSMGARMKRTTHQSPNLQAFVERVVQTLKHEVLNAFCIVNEQQSDHILTRGADWYNNRRCHSERDNRPPIRDEAEPKVIDLATRRIECVGELGGQLKSYRAVG